VARKSFTSGLDEMFADTVIGETASGEETLAPLPINELLPDPEQPRRVLPEDLRQSLLEGNLSPKEVVLAMWERCLDDDLYGKLRAHEMKPAEALREQRRQEDEKREGARDRVNRGVPDWALLLTLQGLVELAESIDKHGLRQPINVYQTGRGYRIAEGERRWLAHVMLMELYLRPEAGTIKSRIHTLPTDDVQVLARQMAENVYRKDLSAIARARAVQRVAAIVEKEIESIGPTPESDSEASGVGEGEPTRDVGGRPRDREAGLAVELHELTGRRLGDLTGQALSGRHVRNLLSLLKLPAEAQALAEAAGLSEYALRPVTGLDDAKAQRRLVNALASGHLTPAQVAAEVRALSRKVQKGTAVREKAPNLRQVRSKLRFSRDKAPSPESVARDVLSLSAKKRESLVTETRDLVAYLQDLLAAVDVLGADQDT
jgi:ParB/RepB/Spo0J family partition protein